jgi:sugar lactone lactonase YvrE
LTGVKAADEVEIVVDGRALIGEGPVWDEATQRLLWVDIVGRRVHAFDPATGANSTLQTREAVTAICPAAGGRYAAATSSGVAEIDLGSGSLRPVWPLPSGDRMNDAKADPRGRFVGGTLTEDRVPGACGLYRFDAQHGVVPLVEGVTLSNGLGWNPDGTLLYFVDTPTQHVDVFDYDLATGDVSPRRVFVDLNGAEGRPDGLTVDAEGGVWVAMVRAGMIHRFTPSGDRDRTLHLPCSFVTSCGFGGADLTDLYVTSGCIGMAERSFLTQPHAGALLRIRPGVTGMPPTLCSLPRGD